MLLGSKSADISFFVNVNCKRNEKIICYRNDKVYNCNLYSGLLICFLREYNSFEVYRMMNGDNSRIALDYLNDCTDMLRDISESNEMFHNKFNFEKT